MTDLVGHGIRVPVPLGWEGRMAVKSPLEVASGFEARSVEPTTSRMQSLEPSSTIGPTFPVTHVGNFALPQNRGDFGSGAVDVMGASNCLIAIVEYGPENVDTPLFARRNSLPRPGPADFDPNTLQRRLIGQSGYQRFCTVNGRAFCVYVVIGASRNALALSSGASSVLSGVEIGPR